MAKTELLPPKEESELTRARAAELSCVAIVIPNQGHGQTLNDVSNFFFAIINKINNAGKMNKSICVFIYTNNFQNENSIKPCINN